MTSKIKHGLLYLSVLLLGGCAANVSAPVSDRRVGPEATPEVVTPESAVIPAPASARYYVVQPGDTLNRIAQMFGHSYADLAQWNQLTDPDQLAVGQTLRVSPPDGVTVTPIAVGAPAIGAMPSSAAPAPVPGGPAVKTGPLATVEPYSDAAWAKASKPPAAVEPPPPPAASAAPAPAAAVTGADWMWPASGKVVSTFNNGQAKGIDIAGKPGDAVQAASGGRVVYAGAGLRGYGKLVIIKHDADFLSAYAHNRALLVKEGQSVTKGQKIAELGNTDADRPKLHFEIRRRGKPVDPLQYLPKR
ncbi:MAG: peptidoglycan DD-metalloendopeptidase family protein [Rhodocyclaceae bacterium]|nr:peptidoglycan DD-metalloendopeptidase family protein [Rhodocyclaceae bacterium]